MTGTFGEAAERLSGAAAMLLGWRPAEFWRATPAELTSMLQQGGAVADGPDRDMLEQLCRRFPDERKA